MKTFTKIIIYKTKPIILEIIDANVAPNNNLRAKEATLFPCLLSIPLIAPTIIPTVPKLAKLTR